jgi:release factor glutamine methyltransferase
MGINSSTLSNNLQDGMTAMRIRNLLHRGVAELEGLGVENAALDVHLLLGACVGKSRTELLLAMEEEVEETCERQFLKVLERRKHREPVAYILEEREFWSLPFHVTSDVLIPRPETEFLLETVIKTVKENGVSEGLLLDLCCGSGVIAIVLALELKKRVIASDVSWRALQVARYNARRHGVEGLIDFVQMDLLTSVQQSNRFALIVSNPPYVSRNEMKNGLDPEVDWYEPHLALDGGHDGLDIINRIHKELPSVLCLGGGFFMEIGATQGKQVQKLFSGYQDWEGYFDSIEVLVDYAGRERVLRARLKRKLG